MKKVVLVGTYSSRNKGDAAMQLVAATELGRELEGTALVLCSPFPGVDAPFYAPVPVVGTHRRRLIRATLQLAQAWLWRVVRERSGKHLRMLVSDEELQTYLDAALVVDLSGDMMTEDYGPHVAYSHFIPVLLAAILRRPYILCAQSIGPFKLTRPLARRVLAGATRITARDEITMQYLASLGLDMKRVEFTADLAFLLDPVSPERVDEIFATEAISRDGPPLLGVSVSQLIESHYQRRNPNARALPLVELLANALDTLASRLDCRVVFVSHVTGPSHAKDDRIISRAVQSRMRSGSHVLRGEYGPRELKGIIARCHVFTGSRMHANIAALSSAVPAVALSYSHKTPGIMALLGQGELVCDVASFTEREFIAKVARAWEDRAHIAGEISRQLAAVQNRSRRNVELIQEVLADGGGCGSTDTAPRTLE